MKTDSFCPPAVQGSVLMITLFVCTFIGIILGSYLFMIRTQNLSVARAQTWNAAMAVAEAGIEEALAHLNLGVTRTPPDPGAHGWSLGGDGMYHPPAPRNLTNGYYNVAISSDTLPVIYSTGYVRAPISSAYVSRTVQVRTGNGYLFPVGIAAQTTIDLKGNGITIDSYDSSDLASFPGGRWNAANARDHGDVATDSTVTNSLFGIQNAEIHGKVRAGPAHGLPSIGPQGSVGDNAWVNGGNKGIKPGWFTDDMNMEFPDVLPPFSSPLPPPPMSGNVAGTNYTYVLSDHNYSLASLSLKTGDTLYVMPGANAVLYVTGDVSMLGKSSIDIGQDATFKIYVAGASASFTTVNTSTNANANCFQYYGLPSNTSLIWNGNAEYMGTVYAPSAIFDLGGGGNDPYDYQGACVVNSVRMNGHFHVHYDENLARNGPSTGLVVTSWREL